MRILLAMLLSVSFLSSKAQMHSPVSSLNYTPWSFFPDYNHITDSSNSGRKWHFSKYASFSAGSIFFAGGGASFLSAPFGVQLSYQLNKNLYTFTGISAAPTFFSVNRLLTDPALRSSYSGYNSPNAYNFGLNSRIEAGLMYINDAKTFSISGSVGIERSSYPIYPSNRANTKKQ